MIHGFAGQLERLLRARSGSDWSVSRHPSEPALRVRFRCRESGTILVPETVLEDSSEPHVERLYRAAREIYEGAHRGPSRWGVTARPSFTCIKCQLIVAEPTDAELERAYEHAENQVVEWAKRAAALRAEQ